MAQMEMTDCSHSNGISYLLMTSFWTTRLAEISRRSATRTQTVPREQFAASPAAGESDNAMVEPFEREAVQVDEITGNVDLHVVHHDVRGDPVLLGEGLVLF